MAVNYFNELSYMYYAPDRDMASIKVVTNIFKRVQTTLETKFNRTLYYPYQIRDQDTPDFLAHSYYGASNYHWVIFLVNDITDPHWDWPLKSEQFEKYVITKYGSITAAATTPHHHETIEQKATADGFGYTEGDILLDGGTYCNSLFEYSVAGEAWAEGDPALVREVSQYDYEYELNESKREIKMLNKRHLSTMISQFRSLVADEV